MAEKMPRRGPVAVAEAIPPEMRSIDEELQVRGKALKAARMKAKVEAREEKEEDRRVRLEEYKMLRVYPAKSYIATGFLRERSSGMICRNQWYMFDIPEDKENPEVTLQLWVKKPGQDPQLRGEVGDLYSVGLKLPNGSSFDINIVVRSAEAILDPGLIIQYSVFDLGSHDKAFTVDLAAWQHYLLFRDDFNPEEMDCRLLYHAICNRWELSDMTLEDFSKLETSDIIMIIERMIPGGDYPRPTVYEACLATGPPPPEPTPEMLRAQDEEDADLEQQVSDKLDVVIRRKFGRRPSYKEI